MFQNILAILSILKLVKRSKFYAPKSDANYFHNNGKERKIEEYEKVFFISIFILLTRKKAPEALYIGQAFTPPTSGDAKILLSA